MASPEIEVKGESLEAGQDDDEDGDNAERGAPLTSSASLPLFVRREEAEDLGGSEADLVRLDMRENGLEEAQSYKNYQETGHGQHKVST